MGRRNASAIRARHVRRTLATVSPMNSFPQLQSPLFFKLPPEIRNLIFEFALRPSPNTTGYCASCRAYYHPFFERQPYMSTDTVLSITLLLTCRLVYYECASLPIRLAIPHIRNSSHVRWLTGLTARNVIDLDRVHWTIDCPATSSLLGIPQFQPNQLTVTVEEDLPLRKSDLDLIITDMWPASLQSLKFELKNAEKYNLEGVFTAFLPRTITLNDGRKLSRRDSQATIAWKRRADEQIRQIELACYKRSDI